MMLFLNSPTLYKCTKHIITAAERRNILRPQAGEGRAQPPPGPAAAAPPAVCERSICVFHLLSHYLILIAYMIINSILGLIARRRIRVV